LPNTAKEDNMAGKGKSSLRGRNASTGQFIKVEQARKDPNHTTVERIPKPGKGGQ
jgi:hypothetical protein